MSKDTPDSARPPGDDRIRPLESREFVVYEPHSSPDGMKVLMAEEAEACELARGNILNLFRVHGYRLIDPPIIDSIESLFSAATPELKQKTMRLTDPEDARPLGIRADITPQIARLDARQMDHNVPQRYAYCGCVIHGKRDHVGAWRNPYQTGVELFGADTLGADLEIIRLAVETCRQMSFDELVLDLGHLGVFEKLFTLSELHHSLRHPLFALMQTKSSRAVDDFLRGYQTSAQTRRLFAEAAHLHGDERVIERARRLFSAVPEVAGALEHISAVAEQLSADPAIARISFDLINSNSYSYERGLVFVLYSPRVRHELIRGGRYNDIGDTFGRPRSAIGFSGYLHDLVAVQERRALTRVYAPYRPEDTSLSQAVARLRQEGRVVVCGLRPGHDQSRLGCQSELVHADGGWQVRALVLQGESPQSGA